MSQGRKETIVVLGAGAWGTALALVLAQNNHRVHLWEFDKAHYEYMQTHKASQYLPEHVFPENLIPYTDLALAMKDAKSVLIVVPSHVFENTLMMLKVHWREGMQLAWATKGLVPPDFLASEVVHALFGAVQPAVITGPTFAAEVAQGLPSSVLVACADENVRQAWASRLRRPYFRIEMGADIVGAQIAGVVKNVLAIAVGLCDGLGYGANTRATIMTLGLRAMTILGEVMGAQRDTFVTVAGIGDLILTCTDDQSRNRRFGLALGQGQSIAQAKETVGLLVEGYYNVQALATLTKKYQLKLSVIDIMQAVLEERMTAKEAVAAWWS